MSYLTLPNELTIGGIVHVQHWRSKDLVIYQNYSRLFTHNPDELAKVTDISTMFHVYRVTQHDPGEELGERIGSYSNLQGAMDAVTRLT